MPMMRFELMAFPLPRECATPAPHGRVVHLADSVDWLSGGQGWIRTNVAFATVLQTAPFSHSGTCPGGVYHRLVEET